MEYVSLLFFAHCPFLLLLPSHILPPSHHPLVLSLKSHIPFCQSLLWCESALRKLELHMAPLSHCVLHPCPVCASKRPSKVCRVQKLVFYLRKRRVGKGTEEWGWHGYLGWPDSFHILCHDFTSTNPSVTVLTTKPLGALLISTLCDEEQEGGPRHIVM